MAGLGKRWECERMGAEEAENFREEKKGETGEGC